MQNTLYGKFYVCVSICMYNIFFKYSINIFIRLRRTWQYIIVNYVSTFLSFCERKISLRKGITFFFIIGSIHPTSPSFSPDATSACASASVLAAKYTLEVIANVGVADGVCMCTWFMMIINYSELIQADDGRLYFHGSRYPTLSVIEQFIGGIHILRYGRLVYA